MSATTINIIWAIVFSIAGALTGVALLISLSGKIHRVFDEMTPNVDEDKEIVRGNQAVAEYFGRVVSAGILGVSIIIAAAVLGGIITALH